MSSTKEGKIQEEKLSQDITTQKNGLEQKKGLMSISP
jgi:hypothetical protein